MRDLVGRRFNGFDLHRSLRALGHDSRMVVVRRQSQDPHVASLGPAGQFIERGAYAAERITGLQGLLSPLAAAAPLRAALRTADVVHWQLIYPHLIGTPWIARAARERPTVWTLHDPWATTGHCVHPLDCERWRTGCGRCPDLARNFTVWFDTTALVWRAKRAAYREAPVTLVVGSPWMKARVAESPLLSGLDCHLIPFGLDLGVWRTLDRAACRARLGIPGDHLVVAFRMPAGAKHRVAKGIPALIEALHRWVPDRPVALLVLDDRGQAADLAARYRVIETGWLDDQRLVEAMTAADVFVMPSLAESFGFMALEAMACGVPVIVTARTALTDLVRPPEAGLSVPAADGAALAAALDRLAKDGALRAAMGRAGRRIAATEHAYDDYVRRHVELYRSLAGRPARAVQA
jgi:glycosyltransferase involved in cell wall biosynthesis